MLHAVSVCTGTSVRPLRSGERKGEMGSRLEVRFSSRLFVQESSHTP
jgi:hypothetical protein